jgi:hypothetical protein
MGTLTLSSAAAVRAAQRLQVAAVAAAAVGRRVEKPALAIMVSEKSLAPVAKPQPAKKEVSKPQSPPKNKKPPPAVIEKRTAQNKALRALLIERWPLCFCEAGEHLLKIGIHRDVLSALPEVPVKRLGIVLSRYCVDRRYLQKMQPGAVRVDLDGNPAGIVTQEEAAIAADKLRLQTAAYRVWQKAQAAERAQVESDSPPPRRLPVLPANDFASVSAVNA